MSIQKHLDKYYNVPNIEDVAELVLDNFKINQLKESDKKILEAYSGTFKLCLNACGLKSLDNLPNMPSVQTLELNDNFLKGSELSKLLAYPKLEKLRLSNNPISSLDELKTLSQLENLQVLDLMDCPITKINNYREEVFKTLPKLKVLDMMYQDGELYESEIEDDEGEEFDEENEDDFLEDDEGEGEEFEEEEEIEDEEEDVKPAKKRKTE